MSNEIEVIERAFAAARREAEAYRAKHGEPMYCGFAWVVVRPANSKLAKILKERYGASKHHAGGMMVYNPSGLPTQSMDIKEEGAYAFARVLTEAGYRAMAQSRAD